MRSDANLRSMELSEAEDILEDGSCSGFNHYDSCDV